MREWPDRARGGLAALAISALALLGCSRAMTPPVTIESDPNVAAPQSGTVVVLSSVIAATEPDAVEAGAPEILRSLLVRALDGTGRFRVVEAADPVAETADAAGKAAAAEEAVAAARVFVFRWRERVGSDWGVAEPASIGFEIHLVANGGDAAFWKARYAVTQEPLTSNLLALWPFARGGVRWLPARDLARIGVDEAINRWVGGNTRSSHTR